MSSSAQTAHPNQQQLAALAQGRLPDVERRKLQTHLDRCPACRQELARLPGAAESLHGQETVPPADAGSPPMAVTTDHNPESPVPADLVNHPRYEILQMLGQGGMGAVYKARHKVMDRVVALKVINAQLVGNDKAVERFRREVQAAAKLHHPNIVTAHDADQAGNTHFLVMEFVEGTDLAKYVEKKGPLPVARACHFIRQAALGLQHAHERGMVHRDIKPHNLMLTAQGVIKVMDFGLARLAREGTSDGGLTGENVLMGTADYIAPEQAEDAHKADIRADIYSLGCSLFHLLAGKPPFGAGTVVAKIMAHATEAVPLAELPKSVPEDLRAVLAKMLAKKPAQRYQTPGEVAQALTPFVKKPAGMKPPPIPTSNPPADARDERTIADDLAKPKRDRTRKRERRWPLPVWISVGVVAAVVLIAFLVLLASRGRQPTQGPSSGTNDSSASDAKQPAALPPTFKNSLGMEFVLVPKGKSWLGGGGGKPGDKEVEIAHDFYLGKYEVTQEEWETVMGTNPSAFQAVAGVPKEDQKRFPVENVSWDDAQLFQGQLNKRAKEEGWVYRLPKEVEWECACRGGPLSNKSESAYDFYLDKPSNQLQADQANIEDGKGLKRTCKVGSYKPNRLGLYDMHGNVWEWCDGVARGGSWIVDSGHCRAAHPSGFGPSHRLHTIGLRLARVPVGKEPIAPPPPPEKKIEAPSTTFKNSLGMEFVLIPKGKSLLGGGGGKFGDREVEIARDFYLGKYEVTQDEWQTVTGSKLGHFSREGRGKDAVKDIPGADLKRFPVDTASWDDVQLFLKLLNDQAKEAGWIYRLPKEAEWEYACRGGPMADRFDSAYDFYFDKPANQLLRGQANFDNVLKRTCKVGSYKPNRLGLYDMHGNVWEWCDDAVFDTEGRACHVLRGGGFIYDAGGCRAAARDVYSPFHRLFGTGGGLRLARVPVAKEPK